MRTRLGRLLRVSATLVVYLSFVTQPATAAEPGRKPNVVLIVADDLGYAELGSYGQEKIRTPHLDRMAAQGMRFTQYYSASPVCAPSRSAMMTGLHSGHMPVRTNQEVKPEGQYPLPASAVTVAELLKAAGYSTAAIGKWGLGQPGTEGDPNTQGFDLFYGYHCQRIAHSHYPAFLRRNAEKVTLDGNPGGAKGTQFSHDLFEREAFEYVRAHADRSEPFFLYLPFTIPHLALQVPEDSLAEYLGQWDDPPYDGKKGYIAHPHPRAAYAAMVTRMDRTVGRLLDLLKERGIDERTLVLFTSDNGPTYGRLGGSDSEFFGSAAKFRGLKGEIYEGGIRVPLLARWPGRIKAGGVSDHVCVGYDLLPTICEAAGLEAPAGIDGLSFLPALLGRADQRKHDFVYWEFPSYTGQQAVRAGQWKAVRRHLNKGPAKTELYDLANDVSEQSDVAAQHPDEVARLESIMREQHTPSPTFPIKGLGDPPAAR